MSKNGIVVKGVMDFASVNSFLDDVVKSFKARKVVVQRGDEFVTLVPTDAIDLELEAVVKKDKQKLSIELAWREEVAGENEMSFRVSSVEPEIVVEEPEAVCATVCADNKEDAKKVVETAAAVAAAATKTEPKADDKNKPAAGPAKK